MKRAGLETVNMNAISGITRRDILKAIPALALSPLVHAQQARLSIPVLKLHNFGLRVTDVERSLDFYQGLFGSPVMARQGETVVLQMGDGPYCYSLSPVTTAQQPGITHIGISVENFDIDRVSQQLTSLGIQPASTPAVNQNPLDNALRSWIRTRGPQAGGTSSGTRELFFADRDGLIYQLNDTNYCGGSGPLGNICSQPEASPGNGLIRLRELSHFTNFVHNREISNQFHRNNFGLDFQAYQGPNSPVIGVGDGIQFLMYVGGTDDGQPTQPGRLDHVCMGMDNFVVEDVQATLESYGITPRESTSSTPPLVHYISMRMPNRGGAEGGTPELYFSDPDGIRIQLQDPSYCGGTAYLGNDCSV